MVNKWAILLFSRKVQYTSCNFSCPLACSESEAVESRPLRMGVSNFLLNSWAVPATETRSQQIQQLTKKWIKMWFCLTEKQLGYPVAIPSTVQRKRHPRPKVHLSGTLIFNTLKHYKKSKMFFFCPHTSSFKNVTSTPKFLYQMSYFEISMIRQLIWVWEMPSPIPGCAILKTWTGLPHADANKRLSDLRKCPPLPHCQDYTSL